MVSKTKAEDEKSSEPTSSLILPSLPEDVIIDILARVPRHCHPTLSLVSKHFRSLVALPELYARRSLLACTENCLYVVLFDIHSCYIYPWYILCRKPNGRHCLVQVAPSTFPYLDYPESSVAVGSKIYVFGRGTNITTNAFSIDCRSHTVEPLPSIPVTLVCRFACFIDGKIHVIGYCYYEHRKNEMVVFDIETQTWEHAMIKPEMEDALRTSEAYALMADKIYIRDSCRSYVYEPKEIKWEIDYMLSSKRWVNTCVVDDVLYYHDRFVNTLRAYDSNQKSWRVVEGLKEFMLAEVIDSKWSYTVKYGGNMALLFRRPSEKIWCAEISLKRFGGGRICGKVEWCDHVLTGKFGIRKSLSVMV